MKTITLTESESQFLLDLLLNHKKQLTELLGFGTTTDKEQFLTGVDLSHIDRLYQAING